MLAAGWWRTGEFEPGQVSRRQRRTVGGFVVVLLCSAVSEFAILLAMRPNLTFRRTRPHDQPILRDMLYHAVFVPAGFAAPDRAVLAQPALLRYVRDWGRQGDDGIITFSPDGEPIGAVWLRVWSEHDHGYGFIDTSTPELSVAVRPESRGCGIGTELLRRLLQRADESYSRVSLSVSLRNPAVRLYGRFGFRSVGADGTTLIMVRNGTMRGSENAITLA